MNELKDICGIELSDEQLKKYAINILIEYYVQASKVLEMETHKSRRESLLTYQEAIKYAIKVIQEGNDEEECNSMERINL